MKSITTTPHPERIAARWADVYEITWPASEEAEEKIKLAIRALDEAEDAIRNQRRSLYLSQLKDLLESPRAELMLNGHVEIQFGLEVDGALEVNIAALLRETPLITDPQDRSALIKKWNELVAQCGSD